MPHSGPEREWDEALDGLFADAVSRQVFPGASLLVAASGSVLLHRSWGRIHYGAGAPVESTTYFDLASLTKPLVTTLLCLQAVVDGRLSLEWSLGRVLPAGLLPASKADITVFQLLNHCSGLPAHEVFYRRLISIPPSQRREILLQWILETPLVQRPGTRCLYSDLGFMLLGLLLEEVLGGSLDRLFTRFVLTPLGIEELSFRPLATATDPRIPPSFGEIAQSVTCAPTEQCVWRERLLLGEVHDENAYCLDGVAGHSGLFGTVWGIFQLLSHLLDVYRGTGSADQIDRDVLRSFWRKPGMDPVATWALGFDTPSPQGSSAGTRFSPASVGHLGFTGTSFWLDPEREIIVILLTNRVHPTRSNDRIRAFRPVVHDLIMGFLNVG